MNFGNRQSTYRNVMVVDVDPAEPTRKIYASHCRFQVSITSCVEIAKESYRLYSIPRDHRRERHTDDGQKTP